MAPSVLTTPRVTIGDADFERFRDFFYRKTGIRFEMSKRYFVDKRLIERIEATGHKCFREYFTFLRFQASGVELQELVNVMTVNETYFFREEYQLRCMVASVLPELVDRKHSGAPLRIWSVPSSSGEEPYSIALYLLEHWPSLTQVDVELMASDIDTRVLARCGEGHYSPRSVQNLPPSILARHFSVEDGGYRISTDLRQAVAFHRINLLDPRDTSKVRNFDIIFCRNLLIYFDEAAQRQAVEVLYDALNPGGFVFLGHSESMSRISSLFTVRRFPDAIAYEKPL